MAMNDSQKKRLENVWEALKHDKIAIFSIAFLAIILILSLLAPVLPLEPNKTDVAHMLEAPSSAHIFGTDEVGRDYLARVIYGGRISLLVGVTCYVDEYYNWCDSWDSGRISWRNCG